MRLRSGTLPTPVNMVSMTASQLFSRFHRRLAGNELGYTLLELLVVLAILGLLIGLVAPQAIKILGTSKHKIAVQSIERLVGVLDIYRLDVGSYPTNEQGLQALVKKPAGVTNWNGPYINGGQVPNDPWGHPFVYHAPSQRPDHEYDLLTLGPTGQQGGTGDNAAIENP